MLFCPGMDHPGPRRQLRLMLSLTAGWEAQNTLSPLKSSSPGFVIMPLCCRCDGCGFRRDRPGAPCGALTWVLRLFTSFFRPRSHWKFSTHCRTFWIILSCLVKEKKNQKQHTETDLTLWDCTLIIWRDLYAHLHLGKQHVVHMHGAHCSAESLWQVLFWQEGNQCPLQWSCSCYYCFC